MMSIEILEPSRRAQRMADRLAYVRARRIARDRRRFMRAVSLWLALGLAFLIPMAGVLLAAYELGWWTPPVWMQQAPQHSLSHRVFA